MRVIDLSKDRIQQLQLKRDEVGEKYDIDPEKQKQIQEAYSAEEKNHPELIQKSIELSMSAARAEGFTSLLNIYLAATKDDYPVNLDHCFSLLRDANVIVETLDADSNYANLQRLTDECVFHNEDKKRAFVEFATNLFSNLKPRLELLEEVKSKNHAMTIEVADAVAAREGWGLQ